MRHRHDWWVKRAELVHSNVYITWKCDCGKSKIQRMSSKRYLKKVS